MIKLLDKSCPSNEKNISGRKEKIIFIGNTSVGKSSIIERYVKNRFSDDIDPTIGSSFNRINVDGNTLEIWDFSGHDRFKSLIDFYLTESRVIVLVFDVNNKSSMDSIEEYWLPMIIGRNPYLKLCIVANKTDLLFEKGKCNFTFNQYSPRSLLHRLDMELTAKYKYQIFYTSAYTGEGIDKLFNWLILSSSNDINSKELTPSGKSGIPNPLNSLSKILTDKECIIL